MEDFAKKKLSARKMAMIGWFCYLLGFVFPLIPIAAVVIGYIGRSEHKGLGYEEHFDGLIRTFWVSLILAIVGLITAVILIGYFVLIGTTIYVVYKAVKGLINLNAFSSEAWNVRDEDQPTSATIELPSDVDSPKVD